MKIVCICLMALVIAFAAACGADTRNASNDHAQGGLTTSGMPANHDGVDHSRMDHSAMKSSPNAASAPYDLQFIDTMTAHHQAAVEMAKAIDGKAEDPELNTLAKKIIADQEEEIDQMKKWREEWFAGAAPAMNMEMTGMAESMKDMDMKRLSSLPGSERDIEFIKQMIPHHVGAAAMAEEAKQKSQRQEIKTLAEQIIREQNAEIKQMQGWLDAWAKK